MKYKIFIDTNQVYNDFPLNEVFNLSIKDLREFLDSHDIKNVNICLPEIVIRERIQHKVEQIEESIETANKQIKSLKILKHTSKEIVLRKDYQKQLEENVINFLKKYRVERVPISKAKKSILIDRALSKMKPFNDNTSGFKDTLIFLSIVEDALKTVASADRYIFCTSDSKGFDEEVVKEFKGITGKELYVVNHMSKITEKLDELLPLNLHLENRNNKIKNLILSKIGDVMVEINQLDSQSLTSDRYGLLTVDSMRGILHLPYENSSIYRHSSEKDNNPIVGYNFLGVDFLSFTETGENTYNIKLSISTTTKYKKDQIEDRPYSVISRLNDLSIYQLGSNPYRSSKRSFSVDVDCNLNEDKIRISHVAGSLFS